MPPKQPTETTADRWAGYADKSPEERLSVLHDAWNESTDLSQRRFFEGRMLEITVDMAEHPEWFDGGCVCALCCSYGD